MLKDDHPAGAQQQPRHTYLCEQSLLHELIDTRDIDNPLLTSNKAVIAWYGIPYTLGCRRTILNQYMESTNAILLVQLIN